MCEADTIGDDVRFINTFRQRIKDCSAQQLNSQIEEYPKALYYKHFKSTLEVEHYLKIDLPFCVQENHIKFSMLKSSLND